MHDHHIELQWGGVKPVTTIGGDYVSVIQILHELPRETPCRWRYGPVGDSKEVLWTEWQTIHDYLLSVG
jgi:hypothetical protein